MSGEGLPVGRKHPRYEAMKDEGWQYTEETPSPDDPILNARRWKAERDAYRALVVEAHNWLLAAGMCDCEYFEGAGTYLCRFAEVLAGDHDQGAQNDERQH